MNLALRLTVDEPRASSHAVVTSDVASPDKSGKATLQVTTIRCLDDMMGIEASWKELEARSAGAVFFQSFDWCHLIWRTKPDLDVRIVVVGSLQQPLAIWPLQIDKSGFGRFASDLSDPFGQYSDLLVDGSVDATAVHQALLDEIRRWRVDGIIARKVRADAALYVLLKQNDAAVVEQLAAPAVTFRKYKDYTTYHESISKKTRKNLRNYSNRMERLGRIDHVVETCPSQCADVIRRCFDMRSNWLLERGQSSVAFADTSFSQILLGLAEEHRCQPQLRTMQLCLTSDGLHGTAEGQLLGELSLHLGFVHNGRYYAYMAAKNPDFDHFSPGRVHMLSLIEACFDEGLDTVDFLPPDMPYKQNFACETVAVESLAIPFSLRGRFAIDVWQNTLRPMVKRAFQKLPTAVRRGVMRLSGCL